MKGITHVAHVFRNVLGCFQDLVGARFLHMRCPEEEVLGILMLQLIENKVVSPNIAVHLVSWVSGGDEDAASGIRRKVFLNWNVGIVCIVN